MNFNLLLVDVWKRLLHRERSGNIRVCREIAALCANILDILEGL